MEHPLVVDKVEYALRSEKMAINTVIMIEVAHFLVKNLPVIGRSKIDTFLSFPFSIADLDYDLTLKAIEFLAKYSHQGRGKRCHDSSYRRKSWLKQNNDA
ncbi:MAG: hypothetical protein ACUVTD_06680 [Nitrososphaerales archaeon]